MARVHARGRRRSAFYERLLAKQDGVCVVRGHGALPRRRGCVDRRGRERAARRAGRSWPSARARRSRRHPGLGRRPLRDERRPGAVERAAGLARRSCGGGPIACEFAQALARLGVEVTMVYRRDGPLARGGAGDPRDALRVLAREGVASSPGRRGIRLCASAAGAAAWSGTAAVDGRALLLATGREPTRRRADPAEAGIELERGGAARRLAAARRRRRGVWALGDAVGGDHRHYQFTHVATHEGPQVAENALRGAAPRPDYTLMPRVTFTDPEVAAVGLTEAEARERGIRRIRTSSSSASSARRARLGESEGFVKVVIDRATRQARSARTIVAAHAGDMLRGADDAAAHAQRRPRPAARDDVRPSDAERGRQGRRARCHRILPGSRGGDDYLVRSEPSTPPPVGEVLLSESVLWSQFMSDCGERVWP